MQQHTHQSIADDGLEPQAFPAPEAEATHRGPFGDLSYGQAQALAVAITAVLLIVAVLVCNLVAWAF
jgi:hypothetical protein